VLHRCPRRRLVDFTLRCGIMQEHRGIFIQDPFE
jgi:hypothetical protein